MQYTVRQVLLKLFKDYVLGWSGQIMDPVITNVKPPTVL